MFIYINKTMVGRNSGKIITREKRILQQLLNGRYCRCTLQILKESLGRFWNKKSKWLSSPICSKRFFGNETLIFKKHFNEHRKKQVIVDERVHKQKGSSIIH